MSEGAPPERPNVQTDRRGSCHALLNGERETEEQLAQLMIGVPCTQPCNDDLQLLVARTLRAEH